MWRKSPRTPLFSILTKLQSWPYNSLTEFTNAKQQLYPIDEELYQYRWKKDYIHFPILIQSSFFSTIKTHTQQYSIKEQNIFLPFKWQIILSSSNSLNKCIYTAYQTKILCQPFYIRSYFSGSYHWLIYNMKFTFSEWLTKPVTTSSICLLLKSDHLLSFLRIEYF